MSKSKKITIRLFEGKDSDLLAWLEELRSPYGEKGEAIKNAIRRGLALKQETPSAQLDAGSLLADIRQVVEAALQTSLAAYAFSPANPADSAETDQHVEACLDGLGQELLLDVEDEPGETWDSIKH